MLYSEIKLTHKVPLTLKIPKHKPLFTGDLNDEQLAQEVIKGVKSIEEGKVYSLEETKNILEKDFENNK